MILELHLSGYAGYTQSTEVDRRTFFVEAAYVPKYRGAAYMENS